MSSSSSSITPEKEKSAFDIIKTWFLNSPSHGIRRIIRANSIPARLFWSLTFVAFTTVMCFFIYTVFIKFITSPTKINLTVRQYRNPTHFPAITFCNLNPLRNDKFLDEFKNFSSPHSPDTANEYRKRFTEYMDQRLAEDVDNKRATILESGYTLDDLRIQCIFNGRKCKPNLTSFFHPNYGNCYTFNYKEHVKPKQRNDISHFWSIDDENAEDSYKLFLELFLYQYEYIPYLDDRAAFRIFIHGTHEIPILSQNSLFLPPTTFTKLIFSQRIITFSQQCRNDLTDDMKQIFSSTNVSYSQSLCFKLCELRFIEKKLKCTDRLLMVFFQFFSQNQTSNITKQNPCLMNNTLYHTIREHFDSRKVCPVCLPECEIVQYTVQSSYADYPNSKSESTVLQRIEKHLKGTRYSFSSNQSNTSACTNTRNKMIRDDIVAVEISASPYATETLAESPMYTWVDLISSIGGQTGLWIGVSLISFIEIAELLFLLVCHFIKIIYQFILKQWKNCQQRFLGSKVVITEQ